MPNTFFIFKLSTKEKLHHLTRYTTWLWFPICFVGLTVHSQDLMKMNRSELHSIVLQLNKKVDSLNLLLEVSQQHLAEVNKLNAQLNTLSNRQESLLQEKKAEIQSLLAKMAAQSEEYRQNMEVKTLRIDTLLSSLSLRIGELNQLEIQLNQAQERITLITDSLQNYEQQLLAKSAGRPSSGIVTPKLGGSNPDFLNTYITNPVLPDDRYFTLKLSKVLVNEGRFYNPNAIENYNQDNSDAEFDVYNYSTDEGKYYKSIQTEVIGIAELFDASLLQWYDIGSLLPSSHNPYTLKYNVVSKTQQEIASKLPKIRFFKNKLMELTLPSGKKEDFLFSLKKDSPTNLGRDVFRWELASEELTVSNDYESYTQDMVWRIYRIEGEYYLALSRPQVERIGLFIKPFAETDYRVNIQEGANILYKNYQEPEKLEKIPQNGENGGFIFFLKPGDARKESTLINPSVTTFLFKLQPEK